MSLVSVHHEKREAISTGTHLGPAFVSGRGAWLTAEDGGRFFDATAGSGAVSLGHQHPTVTAAVVEQAQQLIHTGCKLGSTVRARFTEQLADIVPIKNTKVLPTVTGSEAIESALKVARAATGNTNVISFDRSFHGKTAGALSLTWRNSLKKYSGPSPLGVWRANPPDPRTEDSTKTFDRVCDVIAEASRKGGLAALVIEPVQTTEGVLCLPQGFVDAVIDEVHRVGGLVILDEIYTGLGRCGHLFYSDSLAATPDLLVVGKTLGNGSPIAAVIGSATNMDALPAGIQTSTFSGSPLSCAAAVAVLNVVKESDVPGHARRLEANLRQYGKHLSAEYAFVRSWRVMGGLAAFDCVGPDGMPSSTLAKKFARAALAEKVLLFTGGPENSSVKIVPPLILENGDFGELTTRLTSAAQKVLKEVGR